MTQTIDANTPLADIALSSVEAGRVLHRHRLDYCCGGGRTLAQACRERDLDPDALLAELAATDGPPIPWGDRPITDLIDHILIQYHEPLRPELERLLRMAEKVQRVHADKPGCPVGLAEHLAGLQRDTLAHLHKEEQVLFPAIRAGRSDFLPHPIAAMHREHEAHGVNLSRTRALTDDLTPPDHACTTWKALYQGLEALERELMDHIHLENNVLFPRALGERD